MATSISAVRSLIAARNSFVFRRFFSGKSALLQHRGSNGQTAQFVNDDTAVNDTEVAQSSSESTDLRALGLRSSSGRPRWVRMRERMRDKYGLRHQTEATDGPRSTHDLSHDSRGAEDRSPPLNNLENPANMEDYFGVEIGSTAKYDGNFRSGEKSTNESESIPDDFPFLQNSIPKSMEKLLETTYGTVRLDVDNRPGSRHKTQKEKVHQSEPVSHENFKVNSAIKEPSFTGQESPQYPDRKMTNTLAESVISHENENFFDRQYFLQDGALERKFSNPPLNILSEDVNDDVGAIHKAEIPVVDEQVGNGMNSRGAINNHHSSVENPSNFFEGQFFQSQHDSLQQNISQESHKSMDSLGTHPPEKEITNDSSNFFDERYFPYVNDGMHIGSTNQKPSSPQQTVDNSIASSNSLNAFDEQYFSGVTESPYVSNKEEIHNNTSLFNRELASSKRPISSSEKFNGMTDQHASPRWDGSSTLPNAFDEQYFSGVTESSNVSNKEEIHNNSSLFNRELASSKRPIASSEKINRLTDQHASPRWDEPDEIQTVSEHDSFTTKRVNIENEESDLENDHKSESYQEHPGSLYETDGIVTPSRFGKEAHLQSDWHSSSLDDKIFSSPPKTKQEQRFVNRTKFDIDNPKTAYDLSKQIQHERFSSTSKREDQQQNSRAASARKSKWTGEVDSKGFRILKNQVLDVQNISEDVLLNILRDSVLYEDESVVAIDKPYGLPSHGGPGVHNSVAKFLPRLAEKLDNRPGSQLFLVHRLDKETTGVMVFAKTEEIYHNLLMMFKKRQIIKRYWMLTKGVPNPSEGLIDIPMAEGTVAGRIRMTLRPHYTEETKVIFNKAYKTKKSDALTEYKVLDSHGTTALVECEPKTGVKHQIRCHMAFGLNTPILGDHKYSHFSKLAPQKLYPDAIQRLGIRQATVRYVPMHLHAKQLIIPEMKDGRNLFLSARLPKHFAQNMKWLKIKPPN